MKNTFLVALLGSALLPAFGQAEEVTTVPEGYVTVTVAAGTGVVRTATVLSFPLFENSTISGQTNGAITLVGSSTITNTNASWGTLSTPSAPSLIRITSGAAVGRTFVVASNTSTVLTINTSDGISSDAINLTSLGVVAGDRYQIIKGDTLLSAFGVGNVTGLSAPKGAASVADADTIQLNTGNAWQTYYFDTVQSKWINAASEAIADNVIIRPDSAVIFNRIASSAYQFMVVGTVPSTSRSLVVRGGQTSFISSFWPQPTTLALLGLQNLVGWVSNVNPNLADFAQLRVGSSWKTFYYDGTNWIDAASEAVSNNQSIPVGSGLIIKKKSTATSGLVLTQPLPYSL